MRKRLDEMKKGDAWVVEGTRYEVVVPYPGVEHRQAEPHVVVLNCNSPNRPFCMAGHHVRELVQVPEKGWYQSRGGTIYRVNHDTSVVCYDNFGCKYTVGIENTDPDTWTRVRPFVEKHELSSFVWGDNTDLGTVVGDDPRVPGNVVVGHSDGAFNSIEGEFETRHRWPSGEVPKGEWYTCSTLRKAGGLLYSKERGENTRTAYRVSWEPVPACECGEDPQRLRVSLRFQDHL